MRTLRAALAVALTILGLALVVSPAHAAVTGVDDYGVVLADGSGSWDVAANDGDPNAATDYVTVDSGPDTGGVWIFTDGATTITVDPSSAPAPPSGTLAIGYTLHDGNTGDPLGSAVLHVTVVPDNLQLVAGDGQVTVHWPGLPAGIDGLHISRSTSFITAHDGSEVTSTGTGDRVVSGLTNGTTYYFYVTPFSHGVDLQNGPTHGASPRAGVDQPPVAADDYVSLLNSSTDVFFTPTSNDTDADFDNLTVSAHSTPAHGTLTCTQGSCDYRPSGSPQDDSATYTVADGYGGTATATIHFKLRTGVVANGDNASTFVGDPVVVHPLANDTNTIASDTVSVDSAPDSVGVSPGDGGALTITGVTQDPSAVVHYSIVDDQGDVLSSSTVTVVVGPRRPLVARPDEVTTRLDVPLDISVAENDRIQVPGGFPLSNSGTKITVQPTHGTASLAFAPESYFDEDTFNESTQNLPVIHYTPNAHYLGDDALTYQLQDKNGHTDTATVTIHVTVPGVVVLSSTPGIAQANLQWSVAASPAVDDLKLCYTVGADRTSVPPDATMPCAHEYALPAGVPTGTTMTGLTNDVWYTVTLFVHSDDGTANGVWSPGYSDSFRPGVDSVTKLDGDGGPNNLQVTWVNPVAPQGSTGTTVRASTSAFPATPTDGTSGTTVGAGLTQASLSGLATGTWFVSVFSTNVGTYGDPQHITLKVQAGNAAPVASPDSATINENATAHVSVLANDTDANGDGLDVRSYTQPAHGSVFCSGSAADAIPWSCTYNPNHNFFGDDTFTYVVTDHRFATATGTVTVHVLQVNQAPIAFDDQVTATLGHVTPIDLTQDAVDPDGNALTYTVVTTPGHSSAFSCSAAGACSYTPNALGTDSFTWKVTDNGTNPANLSSSTATMSIDVVANQPPTVTDKNVSVAAGGTVPVNAATGASDPDGDALSYSIISPPQKGTATCQANGSCSYTAGANATGQDSFNFQASDGHGGTASASVIITITHVNHPPVAGNTTVSTDNGTPAVVNVANLTTDSDGDPLTFALTSGPAAAAGTAGCTVAGSCTYTPSATFVGAAQFVYTASDGHGGSDTGTVTVNVTQANRPPHAVNDAAQAKPAQQISVNVAANDSDPDGDPLSFTLNGQPVHGTASCTAAGSCSYQSNGGFAGSDAFAYTVSDGHGHTDSATVTVTVTANRPPTAVNDNATTTANHQVVVDVAANDSDLDGDPLAFAKTTDPAHGSAGCTAAGSCTYTPATDYTGSDTFTYTVSDGSGGQSVGTVSVTVNPITGTATLVRVGPAARSVKSKVTFRGTATPTRSGAAVQLQRLSGSTWSTIASTTESTAGAYSFTTAQPTGAFSYRVLVPAGGIATSATSPSAAASFYQASMPASSTSGDEYVTIKNTGKVAINLQGWTITTRGGKSLRLPSFTLKPGKSVKAHTGKGTKNATNLYLNRPNSFGAHDTLSLKDAAKVLVATRKF